MKTKTNLLAAGILLATLLNCFGQPVITTDPQSQTNVVGTEATFTVLAMGTEPLAYQWRFGTADLAGRTNDTLIVTNVQAANSGGYTVVITNVDGAVTSLVATLTVKIPPTITRQPTNQSASLGANVTFSAVTVGSSPRYFQWRFNETNLPGKTATSLVVTNVQLTNAGDYTLVVTNAAGSVTSQVAHLEVDPTFTKITLGPIVTDAADGEGAAWVDFDNDGDLDLSVNTDSTAVHLLYRNDGTNGFTQLLDGVLSRQATGTETSAWADFDNDGLLDVFVSKSGGYLFRQTPVGTFTRFTLGAPNVDWGVAAADFNNDGFVDLAVNSIDPKRVLWFNDGRGGFTAQTNNPVASGVAVSITSVDYDNDGDLDLLVCNQGRPNSFYRNDAAGGLLSITNLPFVNDGVTTSVGAAWGDFDNDGYLDVMISRANYGGDADQHPPRLFHNNGDGTFTRVQEDVFSDPVAGVCCAWGDYDNDGWLDLFVGDFLGRANLLYHNNGNGTFTRVRSGSPANDNGSSVAGIWGDYDRDGFLDLFVANGVNGGGESHDYLYHNNGNSNSWITIKCVGTVSNRSAVGAKVRIKATIGGKTFWQLREINTGDGWSGNPLEANFGLGDAPSIDTLRIEWPSGIVQTMTNVVVNECLTVVEHQSGVVTTPSFTSVSRSAIGAVDLSVTGDTGLLYLFETSTNLANWTKLGVRSNATGTIQLTDPRATNITKRFYRVSVP